jgi:RNA polymerase sigma-70 factor, ECF subfamily
LCYVYKNALLITYGGGVVSQIPTNTDTTVTLEAHVEAVLNGDTDAYALVVRQCQADLWRYLAHLVFDRETTKDLVQATFVQAYFNLQRYRRGTSFRAWLFTIARNLALNERKKYCRTVRRLDEYREQQLGAAERSDGNDYEQESGRRQTALKECQKTLPEHLEQLIAMRYIQDMEVEQIAEQMKRKAEAIRQSLWRIRNTLRECIERRMAGLQ